MTRTTCGKSLLCPGYCSCGASGSCPCWTWVCTKAKGCELGLPLQPSGRGSPEHRMKWTAGNDNLLTHCGNVPQSLSCYMTNWALQKLHGQMGSTCSRNFAALVYNSLFFYSSLSLPPSSPSPPPNIFYYPVLVFLFSESALKSHCFHMSMKISRMSE